MVCDMITLSVDQTSVILLHLPLRPEYNMCCVSRVKVMGAEEGGRAEAERERDILLSSYPPLSWVYPCTAQYRRTQLETERSEEQWDPDQRPVADTRQYLLLSVPVPGPRCDSGCDKMWQVQCNKWYGGQIDLDVIRNLSIQSIHNSIIQLC